MDLIKKLKGLKNLNDYISVTQELNDNHKNAKISLNMSTVLSLKNIRSLEIEYFNKCHDSGAAFNIFGLMLDLPPSKTWSLLGKELVSLLQYWLDAVRKHLISHHPHWWSFLKILLKFTRELSKKENTLNDTLVEVLSDSLLDLATRGRTNVLQQHEILHTFNQYCAESNREIRLALRMEFDHYFIRLSTMMASCGHVPTQYSTLEALLRWLVPRRDPSLRKAAASRWLSDHLYGNGVRQIFLERPWMNFFQDARDLLNAHNQGSSHVTSVICRKLFIGEKAVVSGTETRLTWLDLNCGSGSLSILLHPKALDAINVSEYSACEVILISSDNTRAAKLYKESGHVMLSITTLEPPTLSPSRASALDSCDVTAVVSGRSPIAGMDAALRTIFQDKYQVLMDVEDETTLSPENFINNHEEDTRFSHPAKVVRRRRLTGYTAWNRIAASGKSPSTASSTSLAQLHDKLAALPHYRYDKEPVSVCAQPKLSRLTELSESDEKQSLGNTNSTLKLIQHGVYNSSHSDKSQSDNELKRSKIVTKSKKANDKQVIEALTKKRKSKSDSEDVKKTAEKYSEIVEVSRSPSLLLVATLGSADESVINDTLERLPTNKDYSGPTIVDLLVQEALQARSANDDGEKCLDSVINTGDDGKKTQDIGNTIENTFDADKLTILQKEKRNNFTVISKSASTDESNIEATNDTPICNVNVRKKKSQHKKSVDTNLLTISESRYEVQVEDFFSQHFHGNNRGDVIISPTLARKINESSSDSSEFGGCVDEEVKINIDQYEILDIDIIECLNYMVDKVCHDFDKYLEREKCEIVNVLDDSFSIVKENTLRGVVNTEESIKNLSDEKDSAPTKKRGIKLKYNLNTANKKRKPSKKKLKSKNKLELDSAEMSIAVNNEINRELQVPVNPENNSSPENKESRLLRKKRKLYSPKDDKTVANATEHAVVDINFTTDNDNEDGKESDYEDVTMLESKKRNSVTPKIAATSYKDIEKDRKRIRIIRAKAKTIVSPKTRKLNEVFDNLKETIDSTEKITLADKKEFDKDMAIFNYTSDSEDEDFKKKKVDLQKRISTTTIDSGNSVISRRGRTRTKVDYKEKDKYSSDETVRPVARRRGKRQNSKAKTPKTPKIFNVDKSTDLADEKMRATALAEENALETSVVVEKPKNETTVEPDPAIQIPEIILVTDDEIQKHCDAIEVNKSKKNERATRKEKVTKAATLEVAKEKDDDGTISPLPGLLVEKVTPQPNYEDSFTSNFVRKVKKMYKTGTDLCANDTNTTQNLLSDTDKPNHSLQMNITDEFHNIQGNVEDNTSFSVRTPNEVGSEKEKYSEISPVNKVEFKNENEQHVSDNKYNASFKSKPKKRSLRLKSNNTQNQSDSDMKYSLRSSKTISKPSKTKAQVASSKRTNINLQNVNLPTEIICIDDNTTNTSIYQIKTHKKEEFIEISEDLNSDKSIATDGITAHGDLIEEPPSQKSLEEPLLPREMVDMDESVIDYYAKLRKEIDYSCNSNSNETITSFKENEVKAKDKVSSPVLAVKRMTSEEIRKWTSPTSRRDEDYDYRRWLPSHKGSNSDQYSKCEKSPTVSVTRLSSKVIKEWITTPKNNKSSDESRLNSSDSVNGYPILEMSCSKANENIDDSNKRKSIISPIKLWNDVEFKQKYSSKKVEEKPLSEIRSKEVSQSEKTSVPKVRRYLLRKFDSNISSSASNLSTSTRIQDSRIQTSPVKRGLTHIVDKDEKRRKVEESATLTESGPSISSVENWLMKMDHNKAGLFDNSVADAIQNIMERLDTTVNEIHQNTSMKFVHLFVDAQSQLGAMKAQQHALRRQSAAGVLARVAQVIDEEFSELDRRSEQIQENFMDNLKKQAIELIKEDRKQKRDMVRLLQDEVQAALELVKKTNK